MHRSHVPHVGKDIPLPVACGDGSFNFTVFGRTGSDSNAASLVFSSSVLLAPAGLQALDLFHTMIAMLGPSDVFVEP